MQYPVPCLLYFFSGMTVKEATGRTRLLSMFSTMKVSDLVTGYFLGENFIIMSFMSVPLIVY
jgi:hypothetical protein